VHLHSGDPGPALSFGVSLGTLSNVSILNMDEQSQEWQSTVTSVGASAAPAGTAFRSKAVPIAVVAVAAGDGLANLFISNGLGACSIVTGGDTMNPSTGDLLNAVEQARSDHVILLPNNKNVIGTANQVAGLTAKKVMVVPTISMQAGLAAILAFSTDQPVDNNVAAMTDAARGVKSLAIARAVRDSRTSGRTVKAGQVIGLVDGDVRQVGNDPARVAISLLTAHAKDAELVTIYRGAEAARPEAEELAESARAQLPGVEIEVVDGDQPYYPYLISIE
ncbi:MAG: DAK2 domain-containing protein, partial [Chloroflexi bacterium]|nr:DAK2 domain-containing protein [Chloroflexota bacterium]